MHDQTIFGMSLSIWTCPSERVDRAGCAHLGDAGRRLGQLQRSSMTFTSYARGNLGSVDLSTSTPPGGPGPDGPDCRAIFPYIRPGRIRRCTTVVPAIPPTSVSIASITDGTEQHVPLRRAQPLRQGRGGTTRTYQTSTGSTGGPRAGTTVTRLYSTFFPPNYLGNGRIRRPPRSPRWKTASRTGRSPRPASIPGGCNTSPSATARSASSRTSIQSWTFNTGNANSYGDSWPDGIVVNGYVYTFGTAKLGVYQALSTRNVGEVVSADGY